MWKIPFIMHLILFNPLVMSDSLWPPWNAARQASLSIINSRSLLKLMSIESVMPSNHLTLCHSLLLLPSIVPSIRVFSNESDPRIRLPKYWSFSFRISLLTEYSGLISFRTHWFELLTVRGTLKSLPQHNSSKVSILWCSAFFIIQLSHPYMTPGKTIALTRQNFVGKVMSLFFKNAVQVDHSFSSKEQASFNFMALGSICRDFGVQKSKVCQCFHHLASTSHGVMGP